MATTPKKLFFILLFILSGSVGVHGFSHHRHHHHRTGGHQFKFKPSKLFIFGDSYVDTGNQNSKGGSWRVPYGITFPGKPAGRFSDGRVFTDYLARFIGMKTPIPYKFRRMGRKHLRYGMNFAYGGTGVFNTIYGGPNMTTQIDRFRELIGDKFFKPVIVQSSVALVAVSGNDYSTYIAINGSSSTQVGWKAFITQVVDQTVVELQRIHSLGIKRIAVNGLEPIGCLPRSTSNLSYLKCDGTMNELAAFHNGLLQQAISKLNNETKESTFVFLDLYTAFMTVLRTEGKRPAGISQFPNPLKPCCVGISAEDSCGHVDDNGVKRYLICEDRTSSFFWDSVHPTQEGWRNVYIALQSTLEQL